MSRLLGKVCSDCGIGITDLFERCNSCSKKGARSNKWKGGRYKTPRGYISVLAPNHPRANSAGRVFEHTLVAEQEVGRYLEPNECVHHINGDKGDNRPENLEVMIRGEHEARHLSKRGSVRDMARLLNCSPTTAWRILRGGGGQYRKRKQLIV